MADINDDDDDNNVYSNVDIQLTEDDESIIIVDVFCGQALR